MFRLRKRIRPTLNGYRIPLLRWERQVLAGIPTQLNELLSDDGPSTRALTARLFPPAYNLDPEKNAEYERLMRQDLLERHLDAARVLAETCNRKALTDIEFNGWMRAVNGMRLVLGTLLDVQEDDDHRAEFEEEPAAQYYGLYRYLSALLDEMISAASGDVFDGVGDDEGHDDEIHGRSGEFEGRRGEDDGRSGEDGLEDYDEEDEDDDDSDRDNPGRDRGGA